MKQDNFKTYSVEEQKQQISDDSVEAAFYRRPDIVPLPKEEQKSRWNEHLIHLEEFREFLSGIPSLEVPK